MFTLTGHAGLLHAGIAYKLNGAEGLKSVADPCGNGPFQFQRFIFGGVDRGFELRAAYSGRGYPEVLIFLEKDGAPFHVAGPKAGEAIEQSPAPK